MFQIKYKQNELIILSYLILLWIEVVEVADGSEDNNDSGNSGDVGGMVVVE